MSFQRPRRAPAALAFALRPLAGAVLLACAASGASAQSLVEVYDAARAYDPTYLGARATAESSQYAYEQAKALNRPNVGAEVSVGVQHTDFPRAVPANETNKSLGATITANQSLFNRQNDITIEQSERQFEAARDTLAVAEEDLIVRVSSAYFDVLSSADALQTVLASERAIGEQLASAKRNFEVGNATITDTREAQARYDLAVAQELAARNDLEVKKVTLDQIVGRAGVIPHGLPATVTLPPVLPSQAQDWVRLAETESPSIKQARLALDVARLETSKARAGHLPTVGLQASYGHTNLNSNVTGVGAFGTGSTGTIGIAVNIPLFAGFAVQNRIRETLLLEQRAQSDVDAAASAVVLGTRTAFLGAQSGIGQVKALEAAEASSRVALEATQLGYRVGVKVNLDVLNSQGQLYQTQRDLSKARYDYLLSTLRLRQAAGTLTAHDIDPLNALLVAPPSPLLMPTTMPTPAATPTTTTAPPATVVPTPSTMPPPANTPGGAH